MPFYGKDSNISTDYIDIFNSWCHFSGDSYFTQRHFSKLSDDNTIIYGLANLSDSDTWRTMATFNYWSPTSTSTTPIQASCIAAGAFPSFGYNFWSSTTPGTYTLTKSKSSNTFKVGSSSSYSFRDSSIPRFIVAAVQAGGGGGGCTMFTDDGRGGGAGGFVWGIIKLPDECSLSITIGAGGGGGNWETSGSSSDMSNPMGMRMKGDAGENSTISLTIGSATTEIMTASGGKGGDNQTKNADTNTAVSGGTASANTTYVFRSYACAGGRGGAVFGKANATGCSEKTVVVTANSGYSTLGSGSGVSLYKKYSTTSGGAQGDGTYPGGGGGSRLASGPAGGKSAVTQNKAMPADGTLGAGGAGGRFYLAQYRWGSDGGDGAAYLWY